MLESFRKSVFRLGATIVMGVCFGAIFYSKDWTNSLLLFTCGLFFLTYLIVDLLGPWLTSIEYFSRDGGKNWHKVDRILFLVFCDVIGVALLVLVYASDYPAVVKSLLFCLLGPGVVYLPRLIYLMWTRSV